MGKTSGGRKHIRVGIDPGHGGAERGAVGNGIEEAEYNLRFASDLQWLLASSRTCAPCLIRSGDSKMGLKQRGEISEQTRCDVVVCVHVNAGPPALRGMLGFHWPGDRVGESIASTIMRCAPMPLLRLGDRSRAAVDSDEPGHEWLQRPRAVLEPHRAHATAVLIELGYLSNRGDARALKDADVQMGLQFAVCLGINTYLRER